MNCNNFIEFITEDWNSDEYIEVRKIADNSLKIYFFHANEKDKVCQLIDNENNVYFGVLPRAEKCGEDKCVKRGNFVWFDHDYHDGQEVPDKDLELEYIENRIGFLPTILVFTGRGYHGYFKLVEFVDIETIKKINESLAEVMGTDNKVANPSRILRLPESFNIKAGKKAEVVYFNPVNVYAPREFKFTEPRQHQTFKNLNELSDSDIVKIKELIKDAYKEGQRQYLLLFLSGWFAKAKISPRSIIKLVLYLYKEKNDNEPLKNRLSAVVYSYKKAGIDIDENDFFELTGVKPYGLEKQITEGTIAGVSGVQDLLENVYGEEKALAIINEISEILSAASPFRDSISEIIDYEKKIFAVANLKKKIIVRARLEDDKFIYKEKVLNAVPTEVIVYYPPVIGDRKFEVTFESFSLAKPLKLPPSYLEEIIEKLKTVGLVYNKKSIDDVITAILNAFINKKKAIIKVQIEAPGFYLVNGKITPIKIEIKPYNMEQLKSALLLLNDLADNWFSKVKTNFATAIKWGVIAPFNYMYKQQGKWIPWLYLFGASKTGKTTIGEIILSIWGLGYEYKKSGANIDTIPRIGEVLSQSTFPVLINEPGNALMKEDIVETLKSSIESTIARGKFVRGYYRDIQAFASLVFTSNVIYPRDDALARRLILLSFSFGERVEGEREKEFISKIKPMFSNLKALGDFVMNYIINNGIDFEKDYITVSEMILEKAYEVAGLEKPDWLTLRNEEESDIYSDIRELIREFFVEKINKEYVRSLGRIDATTESGWNVEYNKNKLGLEERAKIVFENNLIPWLFLKNLHVYIKYGAVEDIRKEVGINITLKSLAEIMEGTYEKKSFKIKGKVYTMHVAAIPYDTFLNFINSEEEDTEDLGEEDEL
jgi:hypothetical protein